MNEMLNEDNIIMNDETEINQEQIKSQYDPLNYRNSYLYLEAK